MLEQLKLQNVGPAPQLEISFRERLNFLAGDNGLGKTFLLDVAWWVLTRTWARRSVVPHLPPAEGIISYRYGTKTTAKDGRSKFNREDEQWSVSPGRPSIPGLVVYAQADGGFAVWDPARNYWKKEQPDRPQSYLFDAKDVWDGNKHCEGLIRDWASWQRENGEAFAQIKTVLRTLSPSPTEPLEPGELRKVSLGDPKRHPTLKMPYGQDVPIIHASAGMRRVVALAYLLVWTWQEHVEAAKLRGDEPTKEIIFLIDEIEAHLHPQWQRRIVPSVLDVMEALTGEHDVKVQLVAATHSPMVLVSTESLFDPDRDAIWELDLVDDNVTLTESQWRRHGDVNTWLTSSTFDLQEPRSLEAEHALSEALDLLQSPEPASEDVERIDALLKAALSDVDRFWLRWTGYRKSLQRTP